MSTLQNCDLTENFETAEEKQARENRLLIAKYKGDLAATDYIAIKIAEGAATAEEYAEELTHRRYWRSEINRLEGIS